MPGQARRLPVANETPTENIHAGYNRSCMAVTPGDSGRRYERPGATTSRHAEGSADDVFPTRIPPSTASEERSSPPSWSKEESGSSSRRAPCRFRSASSGPHPARRRTAQGRSTATSTHCTKGGADWPSSSAASPAAPSKADYGVLDVSQRLRIRSCPINDFISCARAPGGPGEHPQPRRRASTPSRSDSGD